MATGDLEQVAYSLKNVAVAFANGDQAMIDFGIERKPMYTQKKPGSALVGTNIWMGEDDPDITATVYMDDINNPKTLIPNMAIVGFEITSNQDDDAALMSTDFYAKFPVDAWVIDGPGFSLDGEKIAQMKYKIKVNVANPGVNGGY